VVVDERFTLIGSANFTDRGRTRNIEVGVLIDDPDFARQLVRQWQGLVNEGLVERVVG
jgi:phosphatidylserine/phosphatidylglycerophosphate/cardiolipin synthase-like enzyme